MSNFSTNCILLFYFTIFFSTLNLLFQYLVPANQEDQKMGKIIEFVEKLNVAYAVQ